MEKQIIGRGVLAGLIAGALAFIWARVMIEPDVGAAGPAGFGVMYSTSGVGVGVI